QLSQHDDVQSGPIRYGIGVENLCLIGGMNADGNANTTMSCCAYSWYRNVESYFSLGTAIGLYFCFRCEVRDSYMHESADPEPGGGGYLCGFNRGTADCLFENNIMWNGNKVNVDRGGGGGNVIAYNYMDDAWGYTYAQLVEAGVNAGHYTCTHMELLEGNRAQNYKGDSFWGNTIYTTLFRNHLVGLRGARGWLNGYSNSSGPYGDFGS